MTGLYEDLCNMFIRPVRQTYNDYDLGSTLIAKTGNRQNFTFTSAKGLQLKGSFFKHKHTHTNTCVIYLHSFNGSRLESLRYVPDILERAFHFCSFDFAGCGNSAGQYVSLGYNERWDVLKLVEFIRNKYSISQFFIWGRSMGAVTAIKFYSLLTQQQSSGKYLDCKILGLVLDSAFISLKRLVVQVGRSRVNIPEILIKAIFLMIQSSIEERADFKVDELQLQTDVATIRCSTMLITSKQDSFISFNHSEDIFNHLKIYENKQIEYIRGEHYENRDQKIINTVYDFFQKKYKYYVDLQHKAVALKQSLVKEALNGKVPRHQQLSVDRNTSFLKKYELRGDAVSDRKNEPHQLRANNASDKKVQSSTKILLFRPSMSDKSNNHLSSECKTIGSDKKPTFQTQQSSAYKHYLTQKKIQLQSNPQIKIVISSGSKEVRQNNQIHNKSKPNFVGRTFELSVKQRPEEVITVNSFDQQFEYSNHKTEEGSRQENQQNHCNIIADKMRKKGKQNRQKIIEYKHLDREEQQEQTWQHINRINFDPSLKKVSNGLKITFNGSTMDDASTKEQNDPKNQQHKQEEINHNRSQKRFCMTAQQYKNTQMNIIKQVMSSNSDKRKLSINAFAELKIRQGNTPKQQIKRYEQTKSMNNLTITPLCSERKEMKSITKMNSCFNHLSLSQRTRE